MVSFLYETKISAFFSHKNVYFFKKKVMNLAIVVFAMRFVKRYTFTKHEVHIQLDISVNLT